MSISAMTSTELEARADRLRWQIAQDVGELSGNLKPHNLYQETLHNAGVDEISIANAVDFASRRYPIPTLLGAVTLGVIAYSLLRKGGGRRRVDDLKASLGQTASALTESATGVFHQRAEEKKREFVELAQAQIASGAGRLSDAIEKKLVDTFDVLPGGSDVKPLLASGIQILLSAAVSGLLRPSVR
jgi:hypothetical protein